MDEQDIEEQRIGSAGDGEADGTEDATAAAEGGPETERDASRAVLERLRAMMAASDPALSVELLPGETLEELEASFAAATAALARARATAAAPPAVGAGAPGRSEAAPATAFEKIRAGLVNGA